MRIIPALLILLAGVTSNAQYSPADPVTPECFTCHADGIPQVQKQTAGHDNAHAFAKTGNLNPSAFSTLGPCGCNATAIVTAPSDPNTVYAVINYKKIFKSTDRGETWSQVFSENYYIYGIDVDWSDENAEIDDILI